MTWSRRRPPDDEGRATHAGIDEMTTCSGIQPATIAERGIDHPVAAGASLALPHPADRTRTVRWTGQPSTSMASRSASWFSQLRHPAGPTN